MHCPDCGLIIGKETRPDFCRCPRCGRPLRVSALRLADGLERPEFVPAETFAGRGVALYLSEAWLRFDLPPRTRRPEAWQPLLVALREEQLRSFARALGWNPQQAYRDPGPGVRDADRPFLRLGTELRERRCGAILVPSFDQVPRRDLLALQELVASHDAVLLAQAPHPPDPDLHLEHVDFDRVPDADGDLASLDRLWSVRAEKALRGLVEAAGWYFDRYAPQVLAQAFGVDALRAWREQESARGGRPWRETLTRFAVARARRLGLIERLELPRLLSCSLCRRQFLDQALSLRFNEILAGRNSYCGACLARAFAQPWPAAGPWVGPAALDSSHHDERGIQFFRDLPRERFHAFLRTAIARSDQARERHPAPRPSDTWLGALAELGFLEPWGKVAQADGYFRAADGHLVPSLGVGFLDNWLGARGVPHRADARYPADPELNPDALLRADLCAGNTLVEFVGLRGQDEARKDIERRLEIARRAGRPLLAVWAEDLLTPAIVEDKFRALLDHAAEASDQEESTSCPS